MVWGALGLEEFAPLYSVVVKRTKKQEISQTHLWLCVREHPRRQLDHKASEIVDGLIP